jgi:hypothetical protein
MSRPEPILPDDERKILLEVYENPSKRLDTFYFTDALHFSSMADPGTTRATPEYGAAFKKTLRTVESLVEKGLIDGKQLQHANLGMYYADLKVKFTGKQVAIREKRQAEALAQVPAILDIVEAIREMERKKQQQ